MIEIWHDGLNAEKNANDYSVTRGQITNSDSLNIYMFGEGGCIAKNTKL